MAETKNIMIVGVGGQGTLLTSRILGGITVENGYDVKLSEVHGMAQRGGSVVTYVRYGEKVTEPIVEEGQADVLIAFEKLEGARRMAVSSSRRRAWCSSRASTRGASAPGRRWPGRARRAGSSRTARKLSR